MPKSVMTKEIEQFIRDNRFEMSQRDIAQKFTVSKSVIGRYMRKNGLQISKELSIEINAKKRTGRTTFTEEEDILIKQNYLKLSVKALGRKVNRSGYGVRGRMKQLGLIVPKEIIKQRRLESQFHKGNISYNKGKKQSEYMSVAAIEKVKKTQFKKGRVPKNKKPLGSERVCSKDGYTYIKTKEPNVYELKHRVIYEEYYSKTIPPGFNV